MGSVLVYKLLIYTWEGKQIVARRPQSAGRGVRALCLRCSKPGAFVMLPRGISLRRRMDGAFNVSAWQFRRCLLCGGYRSDKGTGKPGTQTRHFKGFGACLSTVRDSGPVTRGCIWTHYVSVGWFGCSLILIIGRLVTYIHPSFGWTRCQSVITTLFNYSKLQTFLMMLL